MSKVVPRELSQTCTRASARGTYKLSLDRNDNAHACADSQKHTWYDAHCDQGQLPLDRQSDDEGGEEHRDAHYSGVELLGDPCVDAVAICCPRQQLTTDDEMTRRHTGRDLAGNGAAAFHVEMCDLLPQQLLKKVLPQRLGRPGRSDANT